MSSVGSTDRKDAAPAASAAASSLSSAPAASKKSKAQTQQQGKRAPTAVAAAAATTIQKVSIDNDAAATTTSTDIPLDFVDVCSATAPLTSFCPLAFGAEERKYRAEQLQGGITAFRGLPLDALARQICVARRPTDISHETLDKLFTSKKDEFFIAAMYAPQFVDRAVQAGCLPMTIRVYSDLPEFLALKLHQQRCIVRLTKPQQQQQQQQNGGPNSATAAASNAISVPDGIRGKKARKYALVVDGDMWNTCVKAISAQHEREHGHCWLNEWLSRCLRALNLEPSKFATNLHCISVVHAAMVPSLVAVRDRLRAAMNALASSPFASADSATLEAAAMTTAATTTSSAVSASSTSADSGASKATSSNSNSADFVAIAQRCLDAQKHFDSVAAQAFCAGEIGCSCGSFYTSLTGCHVVSGSGSVQLGALAALLVQCKYEIWDLGMAMKYKTDCLGGVEIRRNQWKEMARNVGARNPGQQSAAAAAASTKSNNSSGADTTDDASAKAIATGGRKLSELDGYVVRCDVLLDAALPLPTSVAPPPPTANSNGANNRKKKADVVQAAKKN